MYIKDFEIRWSDVDANRHLANSAYVNFMGHTRMSFFKDMAGFTLKDFSKHFLAPVVLYEHIYYFREVYLGDPLRVSLELSGLSADGSFFEYLHNFYDANGKNIAHGEMLGAWIDSRTRKLAALPDEILDKFNGLQKASTYRVLTKEDTRRYNKRPKDL